MRKIRVKTGSASYIEMEDCDIFHLKEWVDYQIKEGAKYVDFEGGDDLCYLSASYLRDETPEEEKDRLDRQESAKRMVEKVNFQEAKETYFKYKDKYEK